MFYRVDGWIKGSTPLGDTNKKRLSHSWRIKSAAATAPLFYTPETSCWTVHHDHFVLFAMFLLFLHKFGRNKRRLQYRQAGKYSLEQWWTHFQLLFQQLFVIIRGIISSKNNQVQKFPPPTPRFIPSGEEPHSGFVQNRVKSVKKHKKTVAAGKAFVIQAEVHSGKS